MEENTLIERCQQGDLKAFDRLVDKYASWVYQIAFRMTNDRDDADDIAQEAFIRAFSAISKFKQRSSFSTWLYRIAVNVCHDELKRRKRAPQPMSALQSEDDSEDPIAQLAANESSDPAEIVEARERQRAVQQAIGSLPEHYRMVLILRDLQGLSYEEIAQVVGDRVGTVKSRINRARLALREKLEPNMELFR